MAHGHHPSHQFETGLTHDAVALDPEHDINARAATLWVVGGAIVVFLLLWIMVPIFMRVLDVERERKIDTVAPKELHEVRATERAFLGGGNPKREDIERVLERLRR
jgi:hypothetical protein